MNIKSLLLGSAAALVAVSGARAADAVVIAEPEPMEYVRVCDTYGVGFYYIPGTETCLKVSGYIRYDIGVGARGIQDTVDKQTTRKTTTVDDNDTYFKRARFQLRLDSRAGNRARHAAHLRRDQLQVRHRTRRSASRLTTTVTYTQDEFGIEHAYIELGGFRVGKTEFAVLDLHRLFVGCLERRSRSLRSVRNAPDRLHLHRRQRLHRRGRP